MACETPKIQLEAHFAWSGTPTTTHQRQLNSNPIATQLQANYKSTTTQLQANHKPITTQLQSNYIPQWAIAHPIKTNLFRLQLPSNYNPTTNQLEPNSMPIQIPLSFPTRSRPIPRVSVYINHVSQQKSGPWRR